MKKQEFLLIIFCILAIAGCTSRKNDGVAIYLLSQDMAASKKDLDQLPLRNEPLISGEDIISYQSTNHIMELTPGAYRRFQQAFPLPVKVDGILFVVCVGSQPIYLSALWTPASSISYDGIVIMQSFKSDTTTINLTLGYPGPESFSGSDPSADPRIVRALEKANMLRSVPDQVIGEKKE